MPIIKKDQKLPASAVIVLIYGPHGVAKTSLSLTTKNPFHLDFDKGLKRAAGRVDSLSFDSENPTNIWQEAKNELEAGSFDDYDTIIVDTIKAAFDDFIMQGVIANDFKAKKDPRKAYGISGEEFISFSNALRNKGKDLYLLCHSKVEQDGELMKNICDITGNVTPAYVLRAADQIGYLSMVNNERVISFNPSDTNTGKNTAELPTLKLPYYKDENWSGWADREITQKLKKKFSEMDEAQLEALQLISDWRASIDALDGEDDAVLSKDIIETYTEAAKITPEHIKKQIVAYFLAHLKKIGWKWDKTANDGKGAFVNTVISKTETTAQQATPTVEEKKA